MTKTTTPTETWHLVDAEGKTLGKLAEKIANLIRGKHKVTFDPSRDEGDNVIIINAEKIRVTSNKEQTKKYYSHSRYPGGFKAKPLAKLRAEKPTEIIRHAIQGMLPKTKSRQHIMRRRLKIYAGPEHPHTAQSPTPLEI